MLKNALIKSRSLTQNSSSFPLLQQIVLADFQNDKLITNVTTSFIDQNGKEVVIRRQGKSQIQKSVVQDRSLKKRELYDLPTNKTDQNFRKKQKINETFRYQKNFKGKASHNSIKEVKNSSFFSTRDKELLYLQRQRGLEKSKFQNIDFIGGDLYDVQDIIGDINKIMDKSNRKNMEIAVRQPSGSNSSDFLRGSKWSEIQLAGLGKLDHMLKNYKSSKQEQIYLQIDEVSPQGNNSSRSQSPALPMKIMGFPPRNKPNNEQKQQSLSQSGLKCR